MSKHTPGLDCACKVNYVSGNIEELCPMHKAAPDMLAACETVDEEWHLAHDELKRGDRDALFGRLCEWQDKARAAIAKAKGD